MLILTIILAAFAPLMTKRKMVDLSNPWRYTSNNSDIYYGMGANQTAMIGQNEKADVDKNPRLLIKTSTKSQEQIVFKDSSGDRNGILHIFGDNLILGGAKLALYTGSSGNTFLGYDTGTPYTNADVSYNTIVGNEAWPNNGSGKENVALGYRALGRDNATISSGMGKYTGNVAVGASALYNSISGISSDARYNTAIGNSAMKNATGATYSVAVGSAALRNGSGVYNTAVGVGACENVEGSNKTCIGAKSGPKAGSAQLTDDKNMVYIGTADSTVYIPGNLVVGQNAILNADDMDTHTAVRPVAWNDTLYFLEKESNDGRRYFRLGGQISASGGVISDKRLKNIGKPFTGGLEQIRELKLYNFTLKRDKEKIPKVGVIAQDLQKIFPDAVKKGDDGYLRIRQDDMFYALVNGVKQLDTLVQGIINEMKVMLNRIQTLEKENKELKKRIGILEKRL